jgi:hypothetical protein
MVVWNEQLVSQRTGEEVLGPAPRRARDPNPHGPPGLLKRPFQSGIEPERA